MHSAPLHVGGLLADQLFGEKECVVLTSATLSTEGAFRYMRNRLGLEAAQELWVGSPFDYRKSTLLFVPSDIPEPGKPGYQRALEQGLIALARATKGRMLVLFTSHSAVRATYQAVTGVLESEGIPVLGHGIDGQPRQLVERFKVTPQSVLMGTTSLWEGIDVVGEALSVVVIAKLPFSVPTDPIFAARSESFDDPFSEYAVPADRAQVQAGLWPPHPLQDRPRRGGRAGPAGHQQGLRQVLPGEPARVHRGQGPAAVRPASPGPGLAGGQERQARIRAGWRTTEYTESPAAAVGYRREAFGVRRAAPLSSPASGHESAGPLRFPAHSKAFGHRPSPLRPTRARSVWSAARSAAFVPPRRPDR